MNRQPRLVCRVADGGRFTFYFSSTEWNDIGAGWEDVKTVQRELKAENDRIFREILINVG